MAPRLSKEDGELIDEILRNNPNSDANELAELFHTTYKSVSERRRKLFQRMRTGIDDRKKPGPKGKEPENKLYRGEKLEVVAGFPTLYNFLPADSNKPLVVFIPGAAHNARIVYGGHSRSRKEDFLACWLNRLGLGLLALSYPLENTPAIMPAVAPGYRIEDWGRQAAETTKKVVDEHHLLGKVILLSWSMGGKILEPFCTAAKGHGLSVELFISLAATPGLHGLRPFPPQVTRSPAGYSICGGMQKSFIAQIAEQRALNESASIISDELYLRDYFGHTPIGLTGWGFKYNGPGPLVEDKWGAVEDSHADNFAALPLIATIYGTSPMDLRHVLADKATWGLMLTYKLLEDVSRSHSATIKGDPTRWKKIMDIVHSAPDKMSASVEGNHFFFVGKQGARETADAIMNLIEKSKAFVEEFSALLATPATSFRVETGHYRSPYP